MSEWRSRVGGDTLPGTPNLLIIPNIDSTIKTYNSIVQGEFMSTKTISASDLRNNLSDALDTVNGNEILIVTRRGKKEHAIIDLDRLEDLLAASNPSYLKTIKEARESTEYLSHDEVFGNL